jgi:hypothetical protein
VRLVKQDGRPRLGAAVAILLILCVRSAPSAQVVQAWVQRYNGTTNGGAGADALALDRDGNVYVTGASGLPGGYLDYVTIAYSSGGKPLWTNTYDGPGKWYDQPCAIAVDDRSGNVYVTGESTGTSGYQEFATIAYSSAGAPLWTNRWNSAPGMSAVAYALAVAVDGTVCVAGGSGAQVARYVTIAYSSSGAPLWTNLYSGPGNQNNVVKALAVDASGNVYVTGWSDTISLGAEWATVAYSAIGIPLWTNRYNNLSLSSISVALAIGVDNSNGNVYATGYSAGPGTGPDYTTIAYSQRGFPLWTNRYNGPGNSTDKAQAVAVDSSSGNVYITGYSYNSASNFEYATLAYSSNGVPLWTNRYKAPGSFDSAAEAIALDPTGDVCVSGYSYAQGTKDDYATIAYSSSGTPLWTNRYNGPANGHDYVPNSACLAVGPDGATYVTGVSDGVHGTATNSEFATLKYVPAPDIFITGIGLFPNFTSRLVLTAPKNVGYRLEASADLKAWGTLTNFPPLPVTSIQYTDMLAPDFPRRFYRTVWSP